MGMFSSEPGEPILPGKYPWFPLFQIPNHLVTFAAYAITGWQKSI
jgi:hypothetical protein